MRILLLDDHALFRQGLSKLLNDFADLEVVAHVGTTGEALALLNQIPVDVVLLDADLGGVSGIDFLRRARLAGFPGAVLIVTAGLDDPQRQELAELRAFDIILKNAPIESLVQRIRDANGSASLGPPAAPPPAAATKPASRGFTARESEVLSLVIQGRTNKQIGLLTESSETAVKGILQQLFRKTGAQTRAQLVRIAFEELSSQRGRSSS